MGPLQSGVAGLALASILLLLGVAAGAVADEPGPAQVRIGALTLAYDAAEWRVEGGGDGFVISCLAEACEGAVFNVTVAPDPDAYCDKEEAWRAAEALFPFADRHPANLYTVGDLAVVMAQSRNGPEFGVPTAVFACITRDGVVYRFASRLGTAPPPVYTGGIMLGLLQGVSAPPGRPQEVEVGGIAVTYLSDRWRAAAPDPSGSDAVLFCLPPSCEDQGAYVTVDARAGEIDCFPETGPADELWRRELREIVAGAPGATIRFHLAAFWSGCRNRVPPHYRACAIHDGMTYIIASPGAAGGCGRSGPELPLEAFLELVEGVSLLP